MNKKEFIERLINMRGCGAKPTSWARGWDDAISDVIRIAEELDEWEQTDIVVGLLKPVISQFVADWTERQKQPDWDYDKKEDTLADSIHSSRYSLELNYWKLMDRVMHDYEAEKKPLYYAKIKGHELVETETVLDDDTGNDVSEFHRNIYFVLQRNGELVIDMKDSGLSGAKHFMSMNEWNNLGINETNADFEELTASHR